MKKTRIRIITTECAGLSATCYIEDNAEALKKAEAEFIAWNEPNSYFAADRQVKRFRRWETVERLSTMENE